MIKTKDKRIIIQKMKKIEELKNTIILGDAYEQIKDIPDKSVDLIITDPPYKIDSKNITLNAKMTKIEYSQKKLINELIDQNITSGIKKEILFEFLRIMRKINILIWCNKNMIIELIDFFVKDQNCIFEIIVWCKSNTMPVIHNNFLFDIEYCLYFREPGVLLNGDYRNRHKYYVTATNKVDKSRYNHPTIKPLQIIKNLILATTKEGSLILDPFIGSGTTAEACLETKRNYIGIEINPIWYKTAEDRINGIDANGQHKIKFEV